MNRIDLWFTFVIELAVLATLFPLVAWGVMSLLKRQSASLRCRVWMLTLIALVLFPPMSRVLPRLVAVSPGTALRSVPGSFDSVPGFLPGSLEYVYDISVIDVAPFATDSAFELRLSAMLWCQCAVVVLWACGMLFALLRILVSIHLAKNLLRNASAEIAELWTTACRNFARKLRVVPPRLAVCEAVSVPMVVGIFRPTILLPKEYAEWTDTERDGVLLHELTHLKRRDPLGLLVSRLVVAIYWFHPFVRMVVKQLQLEREGACDDAVLLHGEEPQGYATFLLKLAAGKPATPLPALGLAMSETNPVEERIDAVLDTKKPRTPMRRFARWATLVVLAVIIFVTALFSPVAPIFPIGVFGQQTYTATALIRIHSAKPYFIYEDKEQQNHEAVINTYIELIQSPVVLEKVLEDPKVAGIAELARQRDKVAWMTKRITVKNNKNSEMVAVSFTAHRPSDAATIINTVVDAYLRYVEEQASQWNRKMVTHLNTEINKYKSATRMLQTEILKITKEAVARGGDNTTAMEAIQRDLSSAETKLAVVRAELAAIKEVLEGSDQMEQTTAEKVVRTQEILVKGLQNRRKEILDNLEVGINNTIIASFLQDQLKQTNMILEKLESRHISQTSEQSAPLRIEKIKEATVPQKPDQWW